jgi:small-conductance mechanosensitive channel
MKELLSQYIGEWGWLTVLAIVTFAFKDAVANFFIGIQFLWGNDFNIDDIVYINGNKKARIVRQNVWKTTFYVYGHNRKFVVPNNMIWKLSIEKDLPKNEDNI